MESTRQQKVSRLLQKDLGAIFQSEVQNLFGHVMITVTKVHVSKDLSIAKIYLSLFGTSDKADLIQKIRLHGGEIRFKLGKKIGKQVRAIPDLQFYEDDSLDYIENIEKLLDE